MKKSLIALSFGTFGLGIAEFVMMGILPDVANGLGVSIPEAGHFIAAYALGVCFGAPILVLLRTRPLKQILMLLVALMMVGNLCAAISPSYGMMLAARFISGLPHGAYFGVASIVADKLADKGKGSLAVAIMIAGMTFANLGGVPLGTFLSTFISWRLVFLLVVFWGFIVLHGIFHWVPQIAPLPDTGFKGQFRFFKHLAPWLILSATLLGNGGAFCFYSYVNPMLVHIAGFKPGVISGLMLLAGLGMVIGNLLGGRLSDKYSPGRVAAAMQGVICVSLIALYFLSPYPFLAVLFTCFVTMGLFAVSSPQHFNLGNALGAYCGGLPIEAGLDYRHPALVGIPFAFLGFWILVYFFRRYER